MFRFVPHRRWLRFTLRGLLVATLILCVCLAYIVNRARLYRNVIAEIERCDAHSIFAAEFNHEGERTESALHAFACSPDAINAAGIVSSLLTLDTDSGVFWGEAGTAPIGVGCMRPLPTSIDHPLELGSMGRFNWSVAA